MTKQADAAQTQSTPTGATSLGTQWVMEEQGQTVLFGV